MTCTHDNPIEFMTFFFCDNCGDKIPKGEVHYVELIK